MTERDEGASAARLERRLARERDRVASLERFIEEKSRSLFLAQQSLENAHDFLSTVLAALPNALVVVDGRGDVVDANEETRNLSGYTSGELVRKNLRDLFRFPVEDLDDPESVLEATAVEATLVAKNGELVPVLFNGAELHDHDGARGYVCIATDLRERVALESRVRESQRLESVGQLAAGIAHELNTPIQFVSDSVRFLADAFEDLERVRTTSDRLLESIFEDPRYCAERAKIEAIKDEIDFDFLVEEIPDAVRRCEVGTERVSTIVRAMKRFSHPGSEGKSLEDVNDAIEAAVTMARSEYKYVADVEVALGVLPLVPCNVGLLNQVLLNLLVNAAHAIQDLHVERGTRGRIGIASRQEGDHVVVEVQDDGCGIPEAIRERVFEPFFTTKVIGRGTGQGLALVRNVIVEAHRGAVEVESEEGRGTCIRLRLPIDRTDRTEKKGER